MVAGACAIASDPARGTRSPASTNDNLFTTFANRYRGVTATPRSPEKRAPLRDTEGRGSLGRCHSGLQERFHFGNQILVVCLRIRQQKIGAFAIRHPKLPP